MSVPQKFKEFTNRAYADQAKAFLNAYWYQHEGEAENLWKWYNKFVELDLEKGKEGKDLDEFNAHRFLEWLGETKTIKEMREQITQADLDFNKRLALVEYALWKFNHKVEEFVKKPQGDSKEVQKLQDLLNKIQVDLEEAQKKAEEASNKEQVAKKAEAELKSELDNLKAQEDAYKKKTEELTKRSEEGGVVSRNKAKAELAQHLAADPLPLSRAKITTEAATKKAQKARQEAEESRKKADDAVDKLAAQFKDAEEKLAEAKSNGVAEGNIWWMERELAEKKKYMPTKAKLKTFGQ